MELKCDHIQSSCTLRELFVTGFTMFFSSRDSDGNAVAPENAKFTPCVKTASLFKYGFRFGTPNAFADHIHKKKKKHFRHWADDKATSLQHYQIWRIIKFITITWKAVNKIILNGIILDHIVHIQSKVGILKAKSCQNIHTTKQNWSHGSASSCRILLIKNEISMEKLESWFLHSGEGEPNWELKSKNHIYVTA